MGKTALRKMNPIIAALTGAAMTAAWSSGPVAVAGSFTCDNGVTIATARELVIADQTALDSAFAAPGGAWHFSSLINEMMPASATQDQRSDFVLNFLSQYTLDETRPVDPSQPVGPNNPERQLRARLDFKSLIIDPWVEKSRELGILTGLALDYAPFKLIAIVNRLDSRDKNRCRSSAGEGRFVFTALNQPTLSPQAATDSQVLPFTLIFEYGLPTVHRNAKSWASEWHKLGSLACQTTDCNEFHQQLKSITDQFSLRNSQPGKPVGNPLNQIRTNEILSFPGEMRELHLKSFGDLTTLVPVPVNRTPDPSFNHSSELGEFVFANIDSVRTETFTLPNRQKTYIANTLHRQKWTFSNLAQLPDAEFEELRFTLSKNTCDGCHSHEHPRIENLDGVYHINPEGELSPYMKNEAIPVRAGQFCELLAATTCTDKPTSALLFRSLGVH